MKPEELAYIAGFIDGEGSFLINRRIHRSKDRKMEWLGYSAYIDLSNNNKAVMDWIEERLNSSSAVYCQHQNGRKVGYRMRISGRLSMRLTQQLLPYLIVKQEAARIFLKFPLLHKKGMQDISAKVFAEMREHHLINGKSHPRYPSQFPSVETLHGASHVDEEKVQTP